MSRTDVHRSWDVQIGDPYNRQILYRYSGGKEQYVSSWRNIGCGCKMCTGQDWRKAANRTERRRTDRLIRAQRWDEINPKERLRY